MLGIRILLGIGIWRLLNPGGFSPDLSDGGRHDGSGEIKNPTGSGIYPSSPDPDII